MTTKTCTRCASMLPLEQFPRRLKPKLQYFAWCKPCEKVRVATWRAENRDRQNAKQRAYYEANREECLRKFGEYREANREVIRAKEAAYRKEGVGREKKAAYDKVYGQANLAHRTAVNREWGKKNRHRQAAYLQKRRAAAVRAMPPQDDELLRFTVSEARLLAKAREALFGFKWEVDHVVPIRGKTVCGLHVPQNLQVIPMTTNRRKSNKFEAA